MSVDISVPCRSCSKPICFGDIACPGCHAAVPDGVQVSLEARLAASSSEFRELKDKIETARTTLLTIAGIEVCYGAYIGFVRANAEQAFDTGISAATLIIVASSFAVGAVFVGLFFFVRRRPSTALWVALGTWLMPQVVGGFVSPLTLFYGVFLKLVVLTLLIRGILAATKAEGVRKRLSADAIQQRFRAEGAKG